MPRRTLLFLVIAGVVALGCVRLGIWQLARLGERRARNALVVRRLAESPVDVARLGTDTAGVRYRRVSATGRFDYAREIVLAARMHEGSPGVNLVTPLRTGRGDTLLLVNRGWVYSPDGTSADRARWREGEGADVTVHGFVLPMSRGVGSPDIGPGRPEAVRWLDPADAARRLGAPVLPFVLVQTDSSVRPGSFPLGRLEPPPLDEGPHQSYAIQWFAFALIAVAGGTFVALTDHESRQAAARGETKPTGA